MILTCKNCKHCNDFGDDFGDVIDEGQEPCWSCLRARGDYLPNHELIEKKKTNADRIRSMSDEEIEAWFWWMHDEMMWYTDSHDFLRKWLKKEVEE